MHISRSNRPRICITSGYPAGIGPEIILKSLASPSMRRLAKFLIIGSESLFSKACSVCKQSVPYHRISHEGQICFSKHDIIFLDIPQTRKQRTCFGSISADAGRASIDYIRKAVSLIMSGTTDALVTAPIHKYAASLSGFAYKGHTEFLASLTKTDKYAMMLAADRLKVVLATTHIPVADISRQLNQKDIEDKLMLTHLWLERYFNIKKPRIAVCGLNPHAGDKGLIGFEEKKIIQPAVNKLRRRKVKAEGPLAADGIFYDLLQQNYDAVLCMYHDQGLVALKMLGRNKSVNITLGLPFIRTSPGHGTALDIAGKNKADPGSMIHAIKTAIDMCLIHNHLR
jgi:4-hydroxythreonine-4-phosphate dehydrogenase